MSPILIRLLYYYYFFELLANFLTDDKYIDDLMMTMYDLIYRQHTLYDYNNILKSSYYSLYFVDYNYYYYYSLHSYIIKNI